MVGNTKDEGKLVLTASTWLTIIGMIAAAIASNFMLISGMQNTLQSRIDSLDERWQQRIAQVTLDIRKDIKEVEKQIPPDWFRKMVERNSERLDNIESELRNR